MWSHLEPGGNGRHRQIVGQRACGGGLRAPNTRATAWHQQCPRERLGRGTRPPPPPPHTNTDAFVAAEEAVAASARNATAGRVEGEGRPGGDWATASVVA
jgi:hypothetical protein